MLRHFLISGTYSSAKAIPSRDLSKALGEYLSEVDVDPHSIMSYTTPYKVSPIDAQLKDVMMNLNPGERDVLQSHIPKLWNALSFLMNGMGDGLPHEPESVATPR